MRAFIHKVRGHAAYQWLLVLVIIVTTSVSAYTLSGAGSGKAETNEAVANQDIPLTNSYSNKQGQYSIQYPQEWIFDDSGKGAVIFSGKKNTKDYFSTVNIQTVLTKKSGGEYVTVKDLMDDVVKQTLAESPKANFLNRGPFALKVSDGSVLQGEYLNFIYSYEGHVIEQWQVAVAHQDGKLFYTWAYTAPIEQYNLNLLTAKAMLSTWSVH